MRFEKTLHIRITHIYFFHPVLFIFLLNCPLSFLFMFIIVTIPFFKLFFCISFYSLIHSILHMPISFAIIISKAEGCFYCLSYKSDNKTAIPNSLTSHHTHTHALGKCLCREKKIREQCLREKESTSERHRLSESENQRFNQPTKLLEYELFVMNYVYIFFCYLSLSLAPQELIPNVNLGNLKNKRVNGKNVQINTQHDVAMSLFPARRLCCLGRMLGCACVCVCMYLFFGFKGSWFQSTPE